MNDLEREVDYMEMAQGGTSMCLINYGGLWLKGGREQALYTTLLFSIKAHWIQLNENQRIRTWT